MGSKKSDVDLLLIGKTGNGKSATGNAILKRRVFTSNANVTSVTKQIKTSYSLYKGRNLKVVDGPGALDTDLSEQEALEKLIDSIKVAIASNPQGYHAFLLVVCFGNRFTTEEQRTVEVLKHIFGDYFVNKFCILVVTHGDNLCPEEVGSFEDWCSQQEGAFKSLVHECRNRVVLFDNRTKDQAKMDAQIDHLLMLVDSVSPLGLRYTDDNFRHAQRERDRIVVEAKLPIVQEETLRESSLILQQMRNIQPGQENQLESLNALKVRAENLERSVRDQDKGTGALALIIANAVDIRKAVEGHIDRAKSAIVLKEEQEKIKAEWDRRGEERERQYRADEEEVRKQMERRIAELEREKLKNEAKLERMRREAEEKLDDLEENNMEVTNNSIWSTVFQVGGFILGNIVWPLLRKAIFKI
ncbi:GIMAP protein [Biomphalaria glabrata]|nr:GIMAP Resistant factor [Biomphalaria glabrata]